MHISVSPSSMYLDSYCLYLDLRLYLDPSQFKRTESVEDYMFPSSFV